MPVSPLSIDSNHPAFAGHFPSHPIVPGVLLLDLAGQAIEAGSGRRVCGLAVAKFVAVAEPGDALQLEYELQDNAVPFRILSGERLIATGRFHLGEEAAS